MDLYGKYNQDGPWFKDQVDYYFETLEDFDTRRDEIIAENNNDLSQKTFGFGDSVTGLEMAFQYTDITSTPKAIYGNNITNFYSCFYGCTSLTTIPEGLFDNCRNVISFGNCFFGCKFLTTIPEGLFDNCRNVTNFRGCFDKCTYLTTIPEGLFDNCSKVTDFTWCFDGCSEVTSALPDAWNKEKFPNVTSYNGYAYNCINATNYSDIPEDWK